METGSFLFLLPLFFFMGLGFVSKDINEVGNDGGRRHAGWMERLHHRTPFKLLLLPPSVHQPRPTISSPAHPLTWLLSDSHPREREQHLNKPSYFKILPFTVDKEGDKDASQAIVISLTISDMLSAVQLKARRRKTNLDQKFPLDALPF